jgi:hypothetical protein
MGNAMTIDLERTTFGLANIDRVSASQAQGVTLFGVTLGGGVWQVTQDRRFYGHYMTVQPAFDAAEAAARAVVASGGAADVRWHDRRPQTAASDQAKGLAIAPVGAMRTMEFRTGSTRIVP